MIIALILLALALVAGFFYVRTHKAQVTADFTDLESAARADITRAGQRIAKLEADVKALLAKK